MRDFLANLLFGGSCFVCRGASQELLCEACAPSCRVSGPSSARAARSPRPAPRCAAAAWPSRRATTPPSPPSPTTFPADALVHALKFRGELALAPFLAELLAASIARSQRGSRDPGAAFRRAAAQPRLQPGGGDRPARSRPAKLELDLCVRARATRRPQIELPWDERRRNVRGAFRCTRALAGASVAVVDDVMTTGATLDEIARTLKRAGAARVVNWVVARTFRRA